MSRGFSRDGETELENMSADEVLEEEEVEKVEEIIGDICVTCKGTGAVPRSIKDDIVTEWKDCPDCVKCPDCKNGVTTLGRDCPRCFKGRVTKASIVETTKNE